MIIMTIFDKWWYLGLIEIIVVLNFIIKNQPKSEDVLQPF